MKGSTRTALSFDPSSLLDERFDADRLTEDLRLRVWDVRLARPLVDLAEFAVGPKPFRFVVALRQIPISNSPPAK